MTLAERTKRSIAFKKQTAFGTLATGAGAQKIQRTDFTLQPSAQSIPSANQIDSLQTRGTALGTTIVQGNLTGELSAGAYADLIGSVLRRNPVAGVTTGALINVTAAAGPPGTFTRATGSYITDGIKVGDVVRISGYTSPATANNRNYRVTALTATVLTVPITEAVVAKAAGDSVTIAVPGKKMLIPATAHTTDWYTVEDFFSDIVKSHVYRDVGFGQFTISGGPNQRFIIELGATGTAQIPGVAQHFTTPSAAVAFPSLTTVEGSLRLLGADVAAISNFSVTPSAPHDPQPGMFTRAPISLGRPSFTVSGSLTVGFEDNSIVDAFNAQTEFAVQVMFRESSSTTSEFINIYMPRVALASPPSIPDNVSSLLQQFNFEAHELTDTAANADLSSIIIQDSRA